MEEFCVAGIQSLLMFVNGEGASTRPPLSLPGQEPPIGLCLKEPYLNVLDTAGILFIFSIQDGSLKQSLEFPSDDESEQQQQSLNQKQNLYQLANIDGQTFIIPPFSGCFFELIAMTIYSQIEENILHGYLDIACSMLEEQISVNFENLNELTHLKQLQQKIAIIFLQKGDFTKAINLLVESEANPNILLSLIAKQNKDIFENFEEFELGNKLKENEIPIENIPVELVKDYLLRIRISKNNDELIESSLARIFVYLNQNNNLNEELLNTKHIWNKQKFRLWLINKNFQNLNFAAKLAFEDGNLEESFNYWKKIIFEENVDEEMKEMALNDCFEALESIDVNLLKSVLVWLIPINPNLCMEKIEYLENNKQIKLLTELIIELFKNEDFDELIYNYLDKKGINELGSQASVHNKFLALLTQKYKQQKQKNNFELRNKIWNFLLFSSFYDKTKALKLFKEEKDKNEFFVEKLFIRANENNSIECLNELANIFELNENMGEILVDAAELLCTRFPNQIQHFKQKFPIYFHF
uniref:Uncharacterized protein n=1 Tax=Meloidogyne enterolobii TaxID=390850 RepID=A0A6V7TLB6_MELEN|nr:unnamed protein product [Meloidogyne enterolobii]